MCRLICFSDIVCSGFMYKCITINDFLDVATTELVVDVQQKEVSIALLEDKRLVELQRESTGVSFSVGDIYLARVKKTMPGLNAAFIDVGYSKEAFLHYLDLGENYFLDEIPSIYSIKFESNNSEDTYYPSDLINYKDN